MKEREDRKKVEEKLAYCLKLTILNLIMIGHDTVMFILYCHIGDKNPFIMCQILDRYDWIYS